MVGLTRGVGPAVLELITDVLEALEGGGGGRTHLCQGAGELFECDAVAHASIEVASRGWSVCLWGACADGSGTLTLTGDQDEDSGAAQADGQANHPGSERALFPPMPKSMSAADYDRRWTASACRRVTLEWMVTPYLAEVPLTREADGYSLLVLGRERPFGMEDVRRADTALRHLVLLEHLVLRLEPPTRPPPHPPGAPLTQREQQVLELLSNCLLARSIAHRLNVSERTVHKHLGNVYRKLDAHDRLTAVERGRELGLLPNPGNTPWAAGRW